MIAALLLAAAQLPSAIDAERAFAADAQRIGMWTAFRKYADNDAVMFTPQAVWAHNFLKNRKDPPKSVAWWPTHSFVSCDGRTAINTGGVLDGEGKPSGYFTTVWQRKGAQWRWAYDGGTPLGSKRFTPRTRKAKVHRAVCGGNAPGAPIIPPPPLTNKQARTTPDDVGRGQSADRTLGWDWNVDKAGTRHFRVYQWTGVRYAQVLVDTAPAP